MEQSAILINLYVYRSVLILTEGFSVFSSLSLSLIIIFILTRHDRSRSCLVGTVIVKLFKPLGHPGSIILTVFRVF